jgi:ABC-type Zn2+ transport system substrate-binding protein/surface adhesin
MCSDSYKKMKIGKICRIFLVLLTLLAGVHAALEKAYAHSHENGKRHHHEHSGPHDHHGDDAGHHQDSGLDCSQHQFLRSYVDAFKIQCVSASIDFALVSFLSATLQFDSAIESYSRPTGIEAATPLQLRLLSLVSAQNAPPKRL